MRPLVEAYEQTCREGSDIREHIPILRALATGCREAVELGTRCGYSTIGLLMAQPGYLLTVDIFHHPKFLPDGVDNGVTTLERMKGDSLKIEIPECDLLFIDTLHTYDQLKEELRLHGQRVRKWIAMHDTVSYGDVGEHGTKGLLPAIREFLWDNTNWRIALDLPYCNGLMVLQKF